MTLPTENSKPGIRSKFLHSTIASTSLFILLCCSLLLKVCSASEAAAPRLIIKTCGECSLKKHPSVAKFIRYDAHHFGDKITVNTRAGGIPRLVLIDSQGEQARVLRLDKLNLGRIRQVVKQLGFEPVQPLLSVKFVDKKYKTDVLLRGIDILATGTSKPTSEVFKENTGNQAA